MSGTSDNHHPSRRAVLAGAGAFAIGGTLIGAPARGRSPEPGSRTIPSTGEQIPAIGLGTWITFNVGEDPVLRARSAEVMRAFFEAGGRMIDSSPMYGSAQSVVGVGLERLGRRDSVFATDKVWTGDTEDGPAQIERSRRLWGVDRFELMQVHNLVGWRAHLETLFAMRADGRLDHVGITTSHGRRHADVERIMRDHPIDCVQLTYNPVDRAAEDRLLPLARERGIGVIVNRPFRRGALTERLEREPLPDWASRAGAKTWAQLILKFILAEPAVTVAIPATTRPEHAHENVAASHGPPLDADLRTRLVQTIADL